MALELASLVAVGLVGTVFWVVSPEAAAVLYGAELGWSPPLVGLVIGISQSVMYALIHGSGGLLVRRWAWLGRKVEATRTRFQAGLERNYLLLSLSGSITGVPPIIALSVLASGFGVPRRHFVPVTTLGRVIRFTVIAAAGSALLAWWRG